jgi:hypothetical protein
VRVRRAPDDTLESILRGATSAADIVGLAELVVALYGDADRPRAAGTLGRIDARAREFGDVSTHRAPGGVD